MATPEGAKHRDIEQRFRDLDRKVRELAGAALTRVRLAVTEGDFVVSGGGDVVIGDGGGVEVAGGSLNFRSNGSFITFYPDGVTPGTFLDSFQLNFGAVGDNSAVFRPGSIDLYRAGEYNGINFGLSNELAIRGFNGVSVTAISTSSSANTYLDLFGKIHVVVSSRKYKQDIEDCEPDPAVVLQMQGRTWRDKQAVADDPDTTERHVGFIAEELDDLGLTEFVRYGEDGLPDAIQYDRLSVALLSVAKDQQRQLDDLTARMVALERRTQ